VSDTLYDLLPTVYRVRDAGLGEPLRALLAVFQDELDLLEDDVDGLYNNWFVETCEEWVVPYIGDLLGVRGLATLRTGAVSQRALVANTIAYRRRKGTAAALELLAHDATGWHAKAVEFFQLLATTQHVNHTSRRSTTLEVRDSNALELLDGPFETASHTADVRHVDEGRGKYDIPNLGIYLWRLQPYPVTRSVARAVTGGGPGGVGRWRFDPLGHDAPLFNGPRSSLTGEPAAPGPLRRRPLRDELEARRADPEGPIGPYFPDRVAANERTGPPPALSVFFDDVEVAPEQIVVCNLGDPPTPIPERWRRPPAVREYDGRSVAIEVGVDPVLGRLALPIGSPKPTRVEVGYSYGFSGDLGGGPYPRWDTVAEGLPATLVTPWQHGVTKEPAPGRTDLHLTLGSALAAWDAFAKAAGTVGIILVMDSRTYGESIQVNVPGGTTLAILAADWPDPDLVGRPVPEGVRPHLRGDIVATGTPVADQEPGTLVLDGLLVEGGLTVAPGELGTLRLANCTLAPGSGGLTVETSAAGPNELLTVSVVRSICAGATLAEGTGKLALSDAIVDGDVVATALDVEGSTVLGSTQAERLDASDSLFVGRVAAVRRQEGCVRYSYLPFDSATPRRYRCVPATADGATLAPSFTSTVFGDPGYCQLASDCAPEILTGADDGGEIGAFNFLQQRQRLANLTSRFDEFLRFGLEAGVFFVT
jgi:phage tail-like protein